MLSRLSAAVVGLLAFAGCILVGLVADNPTETILTRALVALIGGVAIGYLAGALAQVVINEHFRNMVEADIEAEVVAAPAETEGDVAEESSQDVQSDPNSDKGDSEDSREQLQAPVDQATLAARAAAEMLSGT